MDKKLLPWLITFCALGLGGTAGYYSVIGLSKLFAGEATAVIIMTSFLEISKLILATLLHTYWNKINLLLKTYYISALVILSLITSVGIYGMLSNGYQKTADKSLTTEAQISLVETKRNNIQEQLTSYNTEKENINQSISNLRSGLSNNVVQYKDREGNIITTTSSSTRNALEKQLDQAFKRQTDINSKIEELNTQLFEYETQIVEIKTNNNLASELGPLKYLSGLTGVSMDRIINWLLLVIIFVFDPLAISLVIAANFSFAQLKSLPILISNPQVKDVEEIIEPHNSLQEEIKDTEEKPEETFLKPKNELDLNKDGRIDNQEILETRQKIQELENQSLDPNLSSWKRTRLKNQIQRIKSKLEEEEITKTY